MTTNPAIRSSTARFGVAVLVVFVIADQLGSPIPWQLCATVVGSFGLKEAGRRFAGG